MVRASNDNNSFYEASTKSAQLQHTRELACLREELLAERKRHSALLEREVGLRNAAETREGSLREEFTAVQEKLSALQLEHAQSRDAHKVQSANWERERKQLTQEYTTKIATLEREKDEILAHAQQEVHSKTQELNLKYQHSIKNISQSGNETLRQEYEGELLRQGAEMQKRCQHEIEVVRTEERRVAAVELANQRAAYVKREHATSEDLLQLEKLHNTRVSQLEQQLAGARTTNERLQEELHTASLRADKGTESSHQTALRYRREMEEHSLRAEQLQQQLQISSEETQKAQGREAIYRAQLAEALKDVRVKSAELAEAKQQASVGSVEAQQWRKVSKESELSIAAAETSLQIARDEVGMLEFELKRVRNENAALKQELYRADKLIFGVSQHDHQQTPRTCTTNIENAIPRNTPLPDYPLSQQHSAVIYSTPISVRGKNEQHAVATRLTRMASATSNNTSEKLGGPRPASNSKAIAATSSPFAYRTVIPTSGTKKGRNSADHHQHHARFESPSPQQQSFSRSPRML